MQRRRKGERDYPQAGSILIPTTLEAMTGPDPDQREAPARGDGQERGTGDRLIEAIERLRRADTRKHEVPIDSEEFRLLARDIELRARDVFRAAQADQDEPEVDPIEDEEPA